MSQNQTTATQDFYEYVNHDWLEEAIIPGDKPAINSFAFLAEKIEELLMHDVKKIATGEIKIDSKELQAFKDFYQLVSDGKTRDSIGVAPLIMRLARINNLHSIGDWAKQMPDWILSGYPCPFTIDVSSDMKQADTYGVYLSPTSLILPDTTYYTDEHPNKEELLVVYKKMMLELFALIGFNTEYAETIVDDTIVFDQSLVPFMKSAEESADYAKAYNPRTLNDIKDYHPLLQLEQVFSTLLHQDPKTIIVTEPVYFENLQKMITHDTFNQMKHWMISAYVRSFSSILTEDFRQTASQYNLALSGAAENISQEKHYFYLATGQFDQVIGNYYAHHYFGKAAKDDVQEMVEQMIQIYQNRLTKNTWLDDKTKEKAILKLSTLGIHVGYPEKLPDIYSLYKTVSMQDGGTLIDNVEKFERLTREYYFNRYLQKVDRNEWEMSADTVNAYYHPQYNVIVFPAAILQAPFYDFNQSRSANYGGIGAVIAHEISHAFDNNGAKFDEFGNLNNWWSDTDLTHFEALTKQMIDQFDDIPFGNGKTNGTLTVSENIADAGGLSCALEAAQLEKDYNPAELFENWARIWRQKAQEQYTDLLLAIDVHAPTKLRANLQVKNLDAFHELYQTTEQDPMYLAPEKRISIW